MGIRFSDAEEAADASSAMDCIVWCWDTPDNRAWLMTHCDDSADGDALEYWGSDEMCQPWRVHLLAQK